MAIANELRTRYALPKELLPALVGRTSLAPKADADDATLIEPVELASAEGSPKG
jgi:hypothetical protein